MIDGARIVVLIFGVFICGLSGWGIYAQGNLVEQVRKILLHNWGIPFAVFVRVFLGLALIVVAVESRFPRIFHVLGWIVIIAAVGLAFMGRKRLRRFVAWFERFFPALVRLWLLSGIAFGGFLIYGVS